MYVVHFASEMFLREDLGLPWLGRWWDGCMHCGSLTWAHFFFPIVWYFLDGGCTVEVWGKGRWWGPGGERGNK